MPPRISDRQATALVLATFTLVFTALQWFGYTQKSATWDEPIHLTTGYAALAYGDYRVESTHPPFIRMWAALPLLFMRNVRFDSGAIDRTPPDAWHSRDTAYRFSTKFLYVDNDAERLLNAARFMIVLCGLGLGVLVFCWTREWVGLVPAVFALAFYTLSPNILANTSLVTTDAGITLFIFGAVYFLWRSSRQFSATNVAGLALFFAAAMVTKFSALILGPLVAALLAIAVWRGTTITPRRALFVLLLIAAVSITAVWAVYGFRYAPSRSPAWLLHLEDTPLAQTVPTFASITAWIDRHRLLPNMFTEGFLMFAQSMTPPNYTYLAGTVSDDGWWYYFPVAFLIKAPLSFLVLIAIGLVALLRQRSRFGNLNEAFVLVPIALYLAVAIANPYQVGVRHLLPLYPFLLLVTAAGTTMLLRRRSGRYALAVLAGFWALMLATVYPHTLTFFNRVVGGPRHGYEYLADSNVDWGQGLKLLKQWMTSEGVSRIGLAYFGSADPRYYGIEYTALPAATPGFHLPAAPATWTPPHLPGYVAVSATVLTGVYLDPEWQLFYDELRDQTPTDVIGNSIFVYWLDRWPDGDASPPASVDGVDSDRRLGDELLKVQWLEHAITHYRRSLQRDPDQPQVLSNLGAALIATGAANEAVPLLQRALVMAPDVGITHLLLAGALFDTRHDIRDIVAHARRAVALLPDDTAALLMLARALAVGGDLQHADALVTRALMLEPANEEARNLLATIRRVSGRPLD
jgi:4-amino-4-deoxy-L-arabinose transferase-like glycosyltransferase/cytochrome c-type biogenesis protein CcmH/NrfG